MKAKMKAGETIPESGEYLCQRCENRFRFDGQKLVCPKCGTTDLAVLVPVYMEDNPDEEQMYAKGDWSAGD